jgi:NAD(P)H-flavin reductase
VSPFLVPDTVAPPATLHPAPFRVASSHRETHDTWTLELEPDGAPPGDGVGAFAPGQFAMLYAFGAGEVPISVSGDVEGPLLHTVRAVGAVTEALCRLRPGDAVGVRGPYGTAWPLPDAEGRDVVIAAGGIGLAPLRPAIYHVLAHRDRYGEVAIVYGGRSPAELLYVAELEQWRGRFDVSLHVTVDTAPDGWRWRVGVVTSLLPRITFDPDNAAAMLVGPEVMIRFTANALRDRGLPAESIWVSLERSMKCGVGFCGHCQLGPLFVCKDGPVARLDQVERWMAVRQL